MRDKATQRVDHGDRLPGASLALPQTTRLYFDKRASLLLEIVNSVLLRWGLGKDLTSKKRLKREREKREREKSLCVCL